MDNFEKLKNVISALRDPKTGCPWDLKQDLDSLTKYMSEESAEYISAVASKDPKEIKDELGDVLLQVLLNAKVAEQSGLFKIDDVIDSITEKMIRRHPHVFGDTKVTGTEEVAKNWDTIKQQEKAQSPLDKLFTIPKSLDAMMEADQIGRKSKKLNFDWDDEMQVFAKVKEESLEVEEELQAEEQSKPKLEHEIGDLLFSTVQLARHLEINPELALKKCNQRFYRRFSYVAKKVKEGNKDFSQCTTEELENFWKEAKKITE